jgi:uncharacterized repeat protein (TIGR02543 family)
MQHRLLLAGSGTSIYGVPLRIAASGLFVLCAIFSEAQDSQFSFDLNGNLLTASPAIVAPPQIVSQPAPQVVGPGEVASFFVVVTDRRALTYQWRFNDADISGATNETLLLQNVGATNEGQYSVLLANPSGSVTSAPAMLWLDSDGDHMADSWELANFGSFTNYATGDFDGDGASNLTEFLDGTSPTNSASALFRLTILRDGGGAVSVLPDRLSYTNGEVAMVAITVNPGDKFQGWTGAAIGTNNPLIIVMTNNQSLFAHFGAYEIAWTNGASGNWHTPINWSPNLVPNEDDDVSIMSSATIAVDGDAHCRDLSLPGSSTVNFNGTGSLIFSNLALGNGMGLGGSSILVVLNEFDWSGGTLSGSGRTMIAPGATLNINSAAVHFLSGGRTLENGGTILWSGGNLTMGGATITNRAGALFDNQTAVIVNVGGVNRFDNAGTFRKSLNAGMATWPVTFNNSSLVEIQTGRLALGGSGTHSGRFEIAAGASLNFSAGGGAHTADAASVITGAGDVIVSGAATITLAGLVNPSGTHTFSGGTVNLNGTYICTNNPVTISGATVNFNGTSTVAIVNLSSGALGGSAVLNIMDTMNWSGGTMSGSGRTIIPSGASLNLTAGSFATLNTRTLENGGTILWTGAGLLNMSFAVITNRAGALFDLRNNAPFVLQAGSCRFDNVGTLRKSIGTGTSTFTGVSFNNYGTAEILTGTLLFSAACTHNGAFALSAGTVLRFAGGGSSSGAIAAPTTALVEWTTSSFTLNSGAQLNGAGLYRLNGTTLTFNTDAAMDNLDVLGTVNGAGSVTVNNLMNWTSGTMTGSGRTRVAPGATLNLNNSVLLMLQRTLENGGTTLWTGANITLNNAVITNRASALFHAQNAATLMQQAGANRFDNAGTFRKSGHTGTITFTSGVSLNNYNTVEIRSGILAANGGYTMRSNSLLNCALGGTNAGTGFGQLQVAGTVNLNGSLSVDLINGFIPATNDSFAVLTAGTRSGVFTDFFYPSNAVTMQLSNTATSAVVRVTDIIAVAQPVLLTPEISGPNVTLIWSASSNTIYRLEFKSDLNSTNWEALPGDVTSLSTVASKSDTLTSSNRFYRVRVNP